MRRVTMAPLDGPAPATMVQAGSWQQSVPCAFAPGGDTLFLPPEVLEAIGAEPWQSVYALAHARGRHVRVGPLIGVLLNEYDATRLDDGEYGRYRLIVREAHALGAIPVFLCLEGLDLEAGLVRGRIRRNGDWLLATLPLPDVIYDRTTYPDRQDRTRAAALRRELRRRHGVCFLNSPNAMGKRDVADCLRFFPHTAGLVPDTAPFGDVQVLADMLGRHGRVFLKDDYGSHGESVLHAGWKADRLHMRGHLFGRPVRRSFSSVDDLHAFLSRQTASTQWVVQQAIPLARVEGRLFDLRAVAQKDGAGEWSVPLVLVRWARRGEVVTNTSLGADPVSPEVLLAHAGERRPELAGLKAVVTRVARQTAEVLETRFGALGEVGLDIGLDRTGRPWVFEANTKPYHGEDVFLVFNPIQYAAYLALRRWEGRESGLLRV